MAQCKTCNKTYSILTAEFGTGLCNDCLKAQKAAQKTAQKAEYEAHIKSAFDKGLIDQELIEISKQQLFWLRLIGLFVLFTWLSVLFRSCSRQ